MKRRPLVAHPVLMPDPMPQTNLAPEMERAFSGGKLHRTGRIVEVRETPLAALNRAQAQDDSSVLNFLKDKLAGDSSEIFALRRRSMVLARILGRKTEQLKSASQAHKVRVTELKRAIRYIEKLERKLEVAEKLSKGAVTRADKLGMEQREEIEKPRKRRQTEDVQEVTVLRSTD